MNILRWSILNRYISLYVVKATLLVTVLVAGIYVFTSLMGEVNSIGQGQYGLGHALEYVLLKLPLDLYSLFPMVALLGSLIGLGILASHRELVVMRAANMSVFQICMIVLRVAILMLIVVVAIGEGLGTRLTELAHHEKSLAQSSGQAMQTEQGVWLRDRNTFIHIERIMPQLKLEGITYYRFNNHYQLIQAGFAERGYYRHHHWYLENVAVTALGSQHTTVNRDKLQRWQIDVNPKLLHSLSEDPQQIPLARLYTFIHHHHIDNASLRHYRFVFWRRILQPLVTLVMILLAIPFVFGPLRSVPIGVRIVVGVLIGFGFYLLNSFLGPLSFVYQIPALLAAALPLMLFSLISLWLLLRTR